RTCPRITCRSRRRCVSANLSRPRVDPCKNVMWLGIADPISAGTHLLALGAACGTLPRLWRRTAGNALARATALVFIGSMAAQFAASTAYHTIADEPARGVLRR